MDLGTEISGCQEGFNSKDIHCQGKDLSYQSISIVTQFSETYHIQYPLNNSAYIYFGAMILVLALGFMLGIGVMVAYSHWNKRSQQNKRNTNTVLNETQRSTAESESSKSSNKNDLQCQSRSSSTESSPALESAPSDKQTIQPILLESDINMSQSKKLVENAALSQTVEFTEKNKLISPILERGLSNIHGAKYNSNELRISKNLSDNNRKIDQVVELNPKRGLSYPCRVSDIPLLDQPIQNQLEENKRDMRLLRCSTELQGRRQSTSNWAADMRSYNSAKCPSIIGRKFCTELNESLLPADDKQPQKISRQPSPIKGFDQGKTDEDIDGLFSKSGSVKPIGVDNSFYHLTGFFDKVFGDKVLIGRGGFGEVYKVTHKLEQKLYAVKKVKIFVKDGEDIRQNKLFREVFAMTSLHHPNIVRHHTTWTEELPNGLSPKQILRKSIRNRKLTLIKKSQGSLNSIVEHTKVSDLGFQWDLSNSEQNQISKQQKLEEEINSDPEDSFEAVSFKLKTRDKIADSMVEEDKSDDEALSLLNANITKKLANHQLVYLYMQMEYCSGNSLMNFLDQRRTQRSVHEIVTIFKQILEGVQAIHEGGILHRDLKPSNIFFERGLVKIGDFGLSWLGEHHEDDLEPTLNLVPKEEINFRKSNSYTTNIGTPFYSSPEQEKSTIYDNKTDIYSLGIILFELINCFQTKHERGQKIKALREESKIEPEISQKFPDFTKLVLSMTDKLPANRPSVKEAFEILEKNSWKSNTNQTLKENRPELF